MGAGSDVKLVCTIGLSARARAAGRISAQSAIAAAPSRLDDQAPTDVVRKAPLLFPFAEIAVTREDCFQASRIVTKSPASSGLGGGIGERKSRSWGATGPT